MCCALYLQQDSMARTPSRVHVDACRSSLVRYPGDGPVHYHNRFSKHRPLSVNNSKNDWADWNDKVIFLSSAAGIYANYFIRCVRGQY